MTYHLNDKFNYNDFGNRDPIGRFLTARSRMSPPTKKECNSLLLKMKGGCMDARDELIERHLRLVASIAIKYKNTSFLMEDLMAEGIRGLVTALDKFDPTKGSKLSTYAAWWIRQRIQKALSKFTSPVSVPHDVTEAKRKQMQSAASNESLGEVPNETQSLHGPDRIDENLQARIRMVPTMIHSLDEPIGDTKRTLADALSSPDNEKSTYRENGSLGEDLMIAMRFLNKREEKVLKLRFGLGKVTPLKLGEIANLMKISAERVRQLEALGLRKLRAVIMKGGEIDFQNLDALIRANFRGKTKKSPLELILFPESAQ